MGFEQIPSSFCKNKSLKTSLFFYKGGDFKILLHVKKKKKKRKLKFLCNYSYPFCKYWGGRKVFLGGKKKLP